MRGPLSPSRRSSGVDFGVSSLAGGRKKAARHAREGALVSSTSYSVKAPAASVADCGGRLRRWIAMLRYRGSGGPYRRNGFTV
jgi:hypothetical protein